MIFRLIEIYDQKETVSEVFGEYLVEYLQDKPVSNIALSGGGPSTFLYEYLLERRADVDWKNVHFFWGDERCVPPDHAESNFGMANERFFRHLDIPKEHIHRIRGEGDPAEEARRYSEEILRQVPLWEGLPLFDVLILGMGPDGHTASIFPNQMHLLDSDMICAVSTHPENGQKRITLTGKVLSNALKIAFLVTGQENETVLAEILTRTDAWESYPAAHIRSKRKMFWFIDRAAAGQMLRSGRE